MAKFEGSPKDKKEDKKGAKKEGKSLKAFEKSPKDKKEDKKGEKAKPFGKK